MRVTGETMSKWVWPKLPVMAPVPPGPMTSGDCQLTCTVLLVPVTVPPGDMPTNIPVAPSVVSEMTRSNVKAPKTELPPVMQPGQTSRKSPKLMLDGTLAPLVVLGVKVIVAPTPDMLPTDRPEPPDTNCVFGALVV